MGSKFCHHTENTQLEVLTNEELISGLVSILKELNSRSYLKDILCEMSYDSFKDVYLRDYGDDFINNIIKDCSSYLNSKEFDISKSKKERF